MDKQLLQTKHLSAVTQAVNYIHPSLGRSLAQHFFLKPKTYHLQDTQKACKEAAVRLSIPWNYIELQGYRWGTGPAVLLVHGWSGSPFQFQALIESLVQNGFSCLAFDMPGHGASRMQAPTLFDFSSAIRAINQYYGQFAALISHSLGALASAHAHSSEKVTEQLVLVSPLVTARWGVTKFSELTGIPLPLMDRTQDYIERTSGISFTEYDLAKLTCDVREPILVIHDRKDRMAPFNPVVEWAAQHPETWLLTTKGLGHQRLLFDSNVVQNAINFIGKPKQGLRLDDFSELAL